MAFASYYKINGFVDTTKTIGENLDKIAQAAGSFITYDVQNGQFSILFNDWRRNETLAQPNFFFLFRTAPDQVIETKFDDDNILGTMIVTEMPDDEIYNFGEIKYNSPSTPGKFDSYSFDLKTDNPFVSAQEYRLLYNYDINDPPKKLSVTNEFINNDSQAAIVLKELIAMSRSDQLVEFETDFSMLGLTPGDNIMIKNENLGFTRYTDGVPAKVIEIQETDDEEGNIILNVIAQPQDYDRNDGSFINTARRAITRAAGIPPIKTNTDVGNSDAQKNANDVARGALVDPETISQYVSYALEQNDAYFKALLSTIKVPRVGGGTFIYSDTQFQTPGSIEHSFSIGQLTWTIHNPYDETNNEYFPYTLTLRSGSASGPIIDTFVNDGSMPTMTLLYDSVPATTWYFDITWTNGTPSASDADSDRYYDWSANTRGAMKIGGTFLIY